MSFEHIRRSYRVPCRRHAPVVYEGRAGKVTKATNYVWLRLNEDGSRRIVHPTDPELVWAEMEAGATALAADSAARVAAGMDA